MPAQTLHEEYEPRASWWSRLKDTVIGPEESEEDEEAPAAGAAAPAPRAGRQAAPLRLQTARGGRVAVRMNAQLFDDAKSAADGLKGGEYQIVNLERATPQMAERIIDFLNGVCYALDGTVERIGDKVYMFVPANVAVDVDNGTAGESSASRRPAFGDYR